MFVVARIERQLAYLGAGDGGRTGGCAEFDLRGLLFHFHGLSHSAHLHRDVDIQLVAHVQHDAGAGFRLEPLGLDFDRVIPDGQQRGRIGARCLGRDFTHHLIAVGIRDRYLGVRHAGVAGIENGAADGGGGLLRGQARHDRDCQ